MMTEKKTSDVFISYAKEDIESAKRLYCDLKNAGIEAWFEPESLFVGETTDSAIRNAIRECRFFAVLLSKHSVRRGIVNEQIMFALRNLDQFPEDDVFVIPIRLDDCKPSHERLKEIHQADMFPSWESGLEKILKTIQNNFDSQITIPDKPEIAPTFVTPSEPTPEPLPSPPPEIPANPFIAGPPIRDSRFFIGRKEESDRIISLMQGIQPTSVNIVGEPRIGKTSLLYHLNQTWTERVRDKSRFTVILVSMQENRVRKKADFFNVIVRELLRQTPVRHRSDLSEILRKLPVNESGFAQTMTVFEKETLLPVLCLDEFQALFKAPDEFDDDFYESLRAIMDKSQMILIIATHQPVEGYKLRHHLTSRFFNQGHTMMLEGFRDEEITELLNLPAGRISGASPALLPEEQDIARKWGGIHPYLLQMAAHSLCEARLFGKDIAWAKKQFDSNVENRCHHRRFDILNWLKKLF